MKKKTITAIIVSSCLVTFLVTPIIVGVATPSQYGKTYYAELSKMYRNLRSKEKKIVFIGGSAMAFGINVDIIENEIKDYKICPFGLYGQIGTKAMMDLAISYIHKGDIVVLAPEVSSQGMSLYFSGEEMWKCVDVDKSLLGGIDSEQYKDMIGSYYPYLAKKVSYAINGSPHPTDVYSVDSFDDKCQMTYPRPYNILPEFCDYDNTIDFSTELLDKEFISYVNKYNRKVNEKGAKLFYNFCPINTLAVSNNDNITSFYSALKSSLDCFVLGDINEYLLDYEWFYDSNFHMNTSGSIIYSYQVIDDLKIQLGDTSVSIRDEVDKPVIEIDIDDGNNEDEQYFEYEEITNGYKITALKNSGRNKTRITVPTSHNDRPVLFFEKNVFANNQIIEEIVIPRSISKIEDYSFYGCSNLQSIYLESEKPNCNVSSHLLDGADKVKIVVKDYDAYCLYIVNYYWSQFASRITYNK